MSPAISVFRLTDSPEYQKRMFARLIEVVTLQNQGRGLEISFIMQGSSSAVMSAWCLSLRCQSLDPRSRTKWVGEAVEWRRHGNNCHVVFHGAAKAPAPDISKLSPGSIFILETKGCPLAFSIRIKTYAARAKP